MIKPDENPPPLTIEPKAVLLDSVRPDDPEDDWEFKLIFTNTGEETVKPTMVYKPHELFEIDLPDKVEPGEEEFVEMKFDERILDELFTKSFTIELDDSAHTRYTIPVTKAKRWGPTRHAER